MLASKTLNFIIFGIVFLITVLTTVSYVDTTSIEIGRVLNGSVDLSGIRRVNVTIWNNESKNTLLYNQTDYSVNFTSGFGDITLNGSFSAIDFYATPFVLVCIEDECLPGEYWSNQRIVDNANNSRFLNSKSEANLNVNSSSYINASGVLNAPWYSSASDVIGGFSGCSSTQYLGADGACHDDSTGSDTNNYPTSLLITNGSTHTVTIARSGLGDLIATFPDLDTDTTYSSGVGITQTGTVFAFNTTYGASLYVELGDSFGGDVSGTYNAIVVNGANLNYEILSNWENISNKPGYLSNFTRDIKTGNTSAEIQAAELDAAHDTCAEISGCVVGAITSYIDTSNKGDGIWTYNLSNILYFNSTFLNVSYYNINERVGNSSAEIQAAELDTAHNQCTEIEGCPINASLDLRYYPLSSNPQNFINLTNVTALGYITTDTKGFESSCVVALDGSGNSTTISGCLSLINGGSVYVKKGIYEITSSLSMGTNITLEGEGFSTVIKMLNNNHIITNTGGTGIDIKNLRIIGNYSLAAGLGIYLLNVSHSTVQNVWIESTPQHGLQCEGVGCHDNTFENVWSYGNKLDGMMVNDGAHDNTFVNCYVYNNGAYGFGIIQVNENTSAQPQRNTIENSFAYNNIWGINTKGDLHTQIIGNMIYNNTYDGIHAGTPTTQDSNYTVIVGNTLVSNGKTAGYTGIYHHGCFANIQSNSIIDTTNTQDYALYLNKQCYNNIGVNSMFGFDVALTGGLTGTNIANFSNAIYATAFYDDGILLQDTDTDTDVLGYNNIFNQILNTTGTPTFGATTINATATNGLNILSPTGTNGRIGFDGTIPNTDPVIYSNGAYIAIGSADGQAIHLGYDQTSGTVNFYNGQIIVTKSGSTAINGNVTVKNITADNFYDNGVLITPDTDTNTLYTGDNVYVYNNTNAITFNETKANATYYNYNERVGNSSAEIQAVELDSAHDTCSEITGCPINASLTAFYVSRATWTTIDSYPTGCSAGAYVSTIGDTLTCGTPPDLDTNNKGDGLYLTNASNIMSFNETQLNKTIRNGNLTVNCLNIIGSPDSDFCVDDTSAGGAPVKGDALYLNNASGVMYFNESLMNVTNALLFYYKTAIDTQAEIEAIWSVSLTTDTELATKYALNNPYLFINGSNVSAYETDSAHDSCAEISGCPINASLDLRYPQITQVVALNTSQFISNTTIANTFIEGLCYNTAAEVQAVELDVAHDTCAEIGGCPINASLDVVYAKRSELTNMNTSQFMTNATIKDSYIKALNLTVNCLNIIGSPDSDFCADATGAGSGESNQLMNQTQFIGNTTIRDDYVTTLFTDANIPDTITVSNYYLKSNPYLYINLTNVTALGYITDGNTGWDNSYLFYSNASNFTANTVTNSWCKWSGTKFQCDIVPVVDTDILGFNNVFNQTLNSTSSPTFHDINITGVLYVNENITLYNNTCTCRTFDCAVRDCVNASGCAVTYGKAGGISATC